MIYKNNPTLFFQYLAIAKIEKKAEKKSRIGKVF